MLEYLWPFVLRSTYERDLDNKCAQIFNLHTKIQRLESELRNARKNDARDPDTGRFVKAGE